jgi:hypothetical protein
MGPGLAGGGPHFLQSFCPMREPLAGIRWISCGRSRNGTAKTIRTVPVPKVSAPSDVERCISLIYSIPMTFVAAIRYLHAFAKLISVLASRISLKHAEKSARLRCLYVRLLQLILICNNKLRRITGAELGNLLMHCSKGGGSKAAR